MADAGERGPAHPAAHWAERLAGVRGRVDRSRGFVVQGTLDRVVGLTLEAVGCEATVGGRCLIEGHEGPPVEAEVVGFSGDRLFLMPTGDLQGLRPGARVRPTERVFEAGAGEALLGRVLDGTGRPIDGRGPLDCTGRVRLSTPPMNPLHRAPIGEPLDVGVRSINALLSVGRGQRLGLFAGSGVGKSVLLGMMTRYTEADVIVVGLIGERGREVQEFVSQTLGEAGMRRAVVVATPADYAPLLRLHGALLATSIAEYFRDRGRQVLLLMDSLTRYAQAQREIALAIGEPPVTRGYPASAFARLPQLVERAGNGPPGGGSITALYTVLTEGDDRNDPVADAARAILDGHIVLSRELAEAGVYPAVDVESSISRAMAAITTPRHRELVRLFRHYSSLYRQNRDLITIGAYARGSDPRVDRAIRYWPDLQAFLSQDPEEPVKLTDSLARLEALFAEELAAGGAA